MFFKKGVEAFFQGSPDRALDEKARDDLGRIDDALALALGGPSGLLRRARSARNFSRSVIDCSKICPRTVTGNSLL